MTDTDTNDDGEQADEPRWSIKDKTARWLGGDGEDREEPEWERETVPLEGPAWYLEMPKRMGDLLFPEDAYSHAFQHATGQRIEAANGDETVTGEDSIHMIDFEGETEVPIADV